MAPRYEPHYSVSDYLQWEGDWELWNGTAVAMSPSPLGPHERAAAKLVFQSSPVPAGTGLLVCHVRGARLDRQRRHRGAP
jgi:hypothetical protein